MAGGRRYTGYLRQRCNDKQSVVFKRAAFKHQENIVIDKDVQSINSEAFYGAKNLRSVTFNGNSVKTIGKNAFNGCESLTSFSVPSGVGFIGEKAFANCSTLTEFSIPKSVTRVERYVFSGAKCCETEGGAYYVGDWAVDCVPDASTVSLRSGTKHIADRAFMDCKSVKTLYLPNSLESMGIEAFYGSGITEVNIPGSVTSIESGAFKFCISLEKLTLNNGTQIIGSNAFSNCNRLTSVEFPESLDRILGSAFYDCTSLKELIFNGYTSIA